MNQKTARTKAQAVITELTDRKGFDAIWDDCDRETKRDIITAIANIIARD